MDVPPTLSLYTDSALYGSDYTIIVLQTHERSLVGAEAYIKYLQELIDIYKANFDILGVLPVLLKITLQLIFPLWRTRKKVLEKRTCLIR
ncbi:ParA family protein [Listeria grayi]|uniref:ParA family protein n=1 Tax=Listeria grayi TaxID=1641 RepID=UPI002114F104|nr:AAA family ATPase [Listeria grayi]